MRERAASTSDRLARDRAPTASTPAKAPTPPAHPKNSRRLAWGVVGESIERARAELALGATANRRPVTATFRRTHRVRQPAATARAAARITTAAVVCGSRRLVTIPT